MLILVVYFNAKVGSAIVSLIVRILEIHFWRFRKQDKEEIISIITLHF
jgi:hypothetical protein